jgi:DNA-binding GntR family transcriptional regulator
MFEALPRKKRELAVDYALRVLHYNITTLHLEPGQILRETDLTEELRISRTPLREAVIRLSAMYLVDVRPQRGTLVKLFDPDLIEEGRFLRLQVEPAIVEKTCLEMSENDIIEFEDNVTMQIRLLESGRFEELLLWDNLFHEKLFQICGAEKTFHMVSGLCGQYDIIRALSIYYRTAEIAVEDHKKILAALKDRDAAKAREMMTMHISRQNKEYLIIQKKFPQYFENCK